MGNFLKNIRQCPTRPAAGRSAASKRALCLNDPALAQVCLATFQVSRTLNPLLGRVVCDNSATSGDTTERPGV